MPRDLEARRARHREYMRTVWYPKNRAVHMKRVKKNKAEFREWVRSLYQGRACERCGFSDPRALDFHHRDPSTKLFAVARAPTEKGSKATVLAEVAKCIVLCANCHRIEHHSP